MVVNLTGIMNENEISIPGNQLFVLFHTDAEIAGKGFHALIITSELVFPKLPHPYQLFSIS